MSSDFRAEVAASVLAALAGAERIRGMPPEAAEQVRQWAAQEAVLWASALMSALGPSPNQNRARVGDPCWSWWDGFVNERGVVVGFEPNGVLRWRSPDGREWLWSGWEWKEGAGLGWSKAAGAGVWEVGTPDRPEWAGPPSPSP